MDRKAFHQLANTDSGFENASAGPEIAACVRVWFLVSRQSCRADLQESEPSWACHTKYKESCGEVIDVCHQRSENEPSSRMIGMTSSRRRRVP